MGGICSKHSTSVVIPMATSFDPIPTTNTISIVSESKRFIENFLVIWLFDDPSKRFENEKDQLRRLVYKLKAFTNPETCIDFITGIGDEKIFLITSVTYQSISYFSDLPQIEKIYIFDPSTSQSSSCNTFADINQLCKQLEENMNSCEFDLMHFSVISSSSISSMGMDKEKASFIFTQIINEIMVRLKFDSGAKNVWIEFCRRHYANHPEQLRIIEEFAKSYRPNTALDWLRKTCFISRILNRMERTREIDILYKLGFFIKHVHTQLLHLHEENATVMKNISVVYRGKTMLKYHFDASLKDRANGLISFSNFLLATIKKEKMIDFIRRRLVIHPDSIAIIFQIHIDQTIFNEESPFAGLNSDEICFCAGTVFRIESIHEQLIDHSLTIWLVKLNLVRNDDPQLVHLLTPFRTSEIHENPLSCLGKLLIDMGEYRRAEQFFLEMLNDPSVQSQPRRLVRVQNGLATNYMLKGEYSTALEHFKKALEVSLNYLPPDHVGLGSLYKSIGDCYFQENDYGHALQNYERGMSLVEKNLQISKSGIVDELHSLISKTKQCIECNKS